MQTYAEFLATVNDRDLRMLMLAAHKQSQQTNDPTEIALCQEDLDRLLERGLVTEIRHRREIVQGNLYDVFDCVVEQTTVQYLDRMCRERILVNRTPIEGA